MSGPVTAADAEAEASAAEPAVLEVTESRASGTDRLLAGDHAALMRTQQ